MSATGAVAGVVDGGEDRVSHSSVFLAHGGTLKCRNCLSAMQQFLLEELRPYLD